MEDGKNATVSALGLMSGTSLDGLDICLARFEEKEGLINYTIEAAETVPYTAEWTSKLKHAENCAGAELLSLHAEYGVYLGQCVNSFLAKFSPAMKPDIIASHGHTIYHRPEAGYTFQLGDGASLSRTCGIKTISNFREEDVSLGGQGAPLVPAGDVLLFGEYTYCVNIGGFANFSANKNGKRIAADICPANYVLNFLAQREGKAFDDNGRISSGGTLLSSLYEKLNALPFYHSPGPKSLGREWVEKNIFPLMDTNEKTADLMRTFTEHIAEQISRSCASKGKMLVTGGGAHNGFLMERIKEKCAAEIVIPAKEVIDYKEALVFALLGWLRLQGKTNVLSDVTGASRDSSSGTVYA